MNIFQQIAYYLISHIIAAPFRYVVIVASFTVVHAVKRMEPTTRWRHRFPTKTKVPLACNVEGKLLLNMCFTSVYQLGRAGRGNGGVGGGKPIT